MAAELAQPIPEEAMAAPAAAVEVAVAAADVKVPKPDFSMELQEQLKGRLAELEPAFTVAKEEVVHAAAASVA
eukprot:CAMPEP_0168460360 /NCGR_PEP_ID=MMETSP0228-20121227/53404_1 /TAXON_ID=133427 /ORGANISM="Protoceratium reticulatum, Strain CCCM 535 (=CCMP 1889)" /LENGTH=72 /DNA_ID=CAMNT_0008475591 /DNA_START=18 /DNA_END=232 /DNA_ORIENTATION=+